VSELLDGQSLRDILGEGPLAIRKALDLARQVATGLAAAHDKGIIHRDLKPDNVFITRDGRAKILDFGIAKLLASQDDIATLATAAVPRTEAGLVLGTAGYMSPEQIRGATVDHRTDIFALGVMLFEMLSGTRPFDLATTPDTMSAVLSRDPAALTTPEGAAPLVLERIVRRCLEKAPLQRFQSAGDLAFALEAITLGTGSRDAAAIATAPRISTRAGRRESIAWVLVTLLAVTVAAIALWPSPASVPPLSARFTVPTPLSADGLAIAPSISPDGATLAVVHAGASDEPIYIRRLDGDVFVKLAGTEGARYVFWSPDSQSVVFSQKGELRRADLTGSESRAVARLPRGRDFAATAAWGADGSMLLAFPSAPLHRLRSEGGTIEPVMALDKAVDEVEQAAPVFLPDGKRFFYLSTRTAGAITRLADLDSGETHDLAGFDGRIIWAGEHIVVFRRGATLLAQAVTYAPLSFHGAPVQLAGDIAIPSALRIANAAVAPTGLVYRSAVETPQQFTWYARDGRRIREVGPAAEFGTFNLSRDGAWIVAARRDGSVSNLWVIDSAKSTMNRVSVGATNDADPRLSPDGRFVAFASLRGSRRSPYKASLGGQEPELLFDFKGGTFSLDDWSANAEWLLYHDALIPVLYAARMDRLDVEPVIAARALTGAIDQASMSPDGRWIAYNSTETRRAEVFVVPFPPTGDKWQVSTNGGAQPLWRADGRELYYLALDGALMKVNINATKRFSHDTPSRLFQAPVPPVTSFVEQYAVSRDGSQFLFAPFTTGGAAATLTVLTNWMALIERR
jgi:Tol biopolymer transport system component